MGPTVPARIRQAFEWACAWDVAVAKPGNVSHASGGHRMQAQQFLDSADACSAALCEPGAPVGQRIERAVAATWARVGCNTNLGIVLLCVPTARVAERLLAPAGGAAESRWRAAWSDEMAALSLQDAAAAFRGIAQAQPGGLGQAPEQDVRAAPTLGLRAAMALAADRDRIARQYRDAGAELFDTGLRALDGAGVSMQAPAWQPPRDRLAPGPQAEAVQRLFLAFLASAPDSHIVRKHGPLAAQTVLQQALHWQARASAGEPLATLAAYRDWDDTLKAQGLNPGTSADLTVATLFLAALIDLSGRASG